MQDAPALARLAYQTDRIAARLGAPPGISDENNALETGYDPVLRCWPGWLRDLGIRLDLLPEVVEPATPLGTIDPSLAGRSGLTANTVIVAGTTDGCAAFLATGANAVGDAVTSLGSTLPLKQLSERPIFSPEHGAYSHRMSTRWLAGDASNSGGAAQAAFRPRCGCSAQRTHRSPDEQLSARSEEAAVGAAALALAARRSAVSTAASVKRRKAARVGRYWPEAKWQVWNRPG